MKIINNTIILKFQDALDNNLLFSKYIKMFDEEVWKKNPKTAIECILEKDDQIDWEKYLANYPDVQEKNINPLWHFVNYGIFEGRKLYTRDMTILNDITAIPDISVIVPNHNNGIYLKNSLDSLKHQTLKNIEIIIVDDNSTDNSIDEIKKFLLSDKRFKLIRFENCQSQHMARKAGVEKATGKYIMFMDSDDTFSYNACEVAYHAIDNKFDVVCFNTSFISPNTSDESNENAMKEAINGCPSGEYAGQQLKDMWLKDRIICNFLWNKIYRTEIVKRAYQLMEDGYFPRGQDNYASLIIASLANNLLKIDDFLYFYKTRIGISQIKYDNEKIAANFTIGDMVKPLKKYINNNNLSQYEQYIIPLFYMHPCVNVWINYVNSQDSITRFFNKMADQFGIIDLISYIADKYLYNWQPVAKKFKNYQIELNENRKNKSICIMYEALRKGGAENLIIILCNLLISRGYKVILILREIHDNDALLNKEIKVYHVQRYGYNSKEIGIHLYQIRDILVNNDVDIVMSHEVWHPGILWEMMLAKYLRIPVILFQHSDFVRGYLYNSKLSQLSLDNILSCADQLICLSKYAELYYRACGVNAIYMYNPIKKNNINNLDFSKRKNNVLIIGRLGNPIKQTMQTLLILRTIKDTLPDIKFIYLGSFVDKNKENEFNKYIIDNKLEEHVEMKGWVDNPTEHASDGALLLSASYSEGFPLSIAEIQAYGLPAVIYDLPIMMAENNPSIIKVKQGDYSKAAEEIIALLTDEQRLETLSKVAQYNAMQYSVEKYIDIFMYNLETFTKYCKLNNYDIADYRNTIRYLSFYASKSYVK